MTLTVKTNWALEAGEVAQWLRTLATSLDDLGLGPNTNIAVHNCL